MVAEDDRHSGRRAAGLFCIRGEPLPKTQSLLRIVSGARHKCEAYAIRFGFLGSAVRKFTTNLRCQSVSCCGCSLSGLTGGAQRTAENLATSLHQHGFAHTLAAVMKNGVRDFVTEDSCQAGFVLCDRKNTTIDADLPAWETECIGFLAIENDKFPLSIGQVLARDGREPFANFLHQSVGGRVSANRRLLFHLIERGQAKLHFL